MNIQDVNGHYRTDRHNQYRGRRRTQCGIVAGLQSGIRPCEGLRLSGKSAKPTSPAFFSSLAPRPRPLFVNAGLPDGSVYVSVFDRNSTFPAISGTAGKQTAWNTSIELMVLRKRLTFLPVRTTPNFSLSRTTPSLLLDVYFARFCARVVWPSRFGFSFQIIIVSNIISTRCAQ